MVRDRELSHSLELPSIEALASQSAWLLLALKGREGLGMLSAERITTEIVEPETPTCYKRPRNAKTSDQEIVEAKMAGHEGRRSLVPSIFADATQLHPSCNAGLYGLHGRQQTRLPLLDLFGSIIQYMGPI